MQYASEHAGVLTSVHQWKPVTPDRFAILLHHYSTARADEHGSDGVHTKAIALDRDATATVWYAAKDRGHPVSSPVLMTMEGPSGKTVCFETTTAEFSAEPASAPEVIRGAMAYREKLRNDHLKAVAAAVAKPGPPVVVIIPNEASKAEVMRACVNPQGRRICFTLTTDVVGAMESAEPIEGVWLHNAEGIGLPNLGSVMDRIAQRMKGEGWMAMTGHRPFGYPAPDGLPKRRL